MSEPALAADLTRQHAPALQLVEPAAEPDRPSRPPRPQRRLEIPRYDLAKALNLERTLGISHVLAQLLVRRGLDDPEQARAFLDADERHDPSAFTGIDRATSLIERHIAAGSRITVHGDYDVDGICATAIMVRALKALGADVNWFLPDRLDDGYGLSTATIARLSARETGLLVTVDCGITAVDEVRAAHESGIDVVVSDHHAPRADGKLPDCPIVHPAVCGYPCPELCGTGVAFKLAQALGAPTAAEDIELVALATVADLMPLQGENRALVRAGLAAIAGTAAARPAGADGRGPRRPERSRCAFAWLPAGPADQRRGGIRRADAGLELLLTEDSERAREIASELDSVNVERRAIEERIVWEAEAQVAELGERSAYVLWAEGWHPGVIGIVASRVVERYHRPAILIALDEAGTATDRAGASRASTCWARCTPRPSTWGATAVTGPRPG